MLLPISSEVIFSPRDVIKEIGKKMTEKAGDLQSSSYITERISQIIQGGNAAIVLTALCSEELSCM